MIFCEYWVPRSYVSMKKRGTGCIAPKIRLAHFEGSKTMRGADWRFQNSAGQRLKANFPCGVFDFSIRAPQNFEPPCALLSHGGLNIHKNHLKTQCSLFFKGYFCKVVYLFGYNNFISKIRHNQNRHVIK